MNLSINVMLDTSASMHGTVLPTIRDGYDILRAMLPQIFHNWSNRYFSALSYESDAQVLCRQIALEEAPPLLQTKAQGLSNLGRALNIFADWLEEDSQDAAVLAFLFCDGPGTDHWQNACERLKPYQKRFVLIGIHPPKALHIDKLCSLSYSLPITEIHVGLETILQREETHLLEIYHQRNLVEDEDN